MQSGMGIAQDIKDLVNAGHVVTTPVAPVQIGTWSGTGYVALNHLTDSGAYVIEGGAAGGVGNVTLLTIVLFINCVALWFSFYNMALILTLSAYVLFIVISNALAALFAAAAIWGKAFYLILIIAYSTLVQGGFVLAVWDLFSKLYWPAIKACFGSPPPQAAKMFRRENALL